MQSQNNINYGCLKGEWSVIEGGLFPEFLNKDKQGMVLQAETATRIQYASEVFSVDRRRPSAHPDNLTLRQPPIVFAAANARRCIAVITRHPPLVFQRIFTASISRGKDHVFYFSSI
jgi:hypothetical protein